MKGGDIRQAMANAYIMMDDPRYSSVQEVDPSKLSTTQKTVNVDRVQEYMSNPGTTANVSGGGVGNDVIVASVNGKMGIIDGNHRAAAALLAGRTLTARVVDMDRAFKDMGHIPGKKADSIGHFLYQLRDGADKMAKAAPRKTRRVPMTHRTRAVRRGESRLTAELTGVLHRIGEEAASAAVRHLDLGKAGPDDARRASEVAAIAVQGVDWTLLVDPTEAQLAAVTRDGAMRALLALGVTDKGITDQVFQTAADWARERAAELVGMRYNAAGDLVENPDAEMAITDTARDAIRGAVADAIEQGQSAADLRSAVEDLGDFSAERAGMIARTEIIRANNQGHLAAFKASDAVKMKEWSTAEDGDVCDECEGNEDQGPIGLDADFDSGDDAAPAHPNCRCTIVAVVDDGE